MSDLIKVPDKTQYVAVLGDDVPNSLLVGGVTEKFVPNINLSKWNDEIFFNINLPAIQVGTDKETYSSTEKGIVGIRVGDVEFKTWPIDDKVLEIAVIHYKPQTAKSIEFDLQYTNGLEFWFQPEIPDEQAKKYVDSGEAKTLTEAKRMIRPANVVGSYSVRWTKQNNKYKTGKICHLYRWLAIDANKKELWCDELKIDEVNKKLIIGLPDLSGMIYPITFMGAGDTLGNTSEGTSYDYWNSRITAIGPFQAPADATITDIKIRLGGTSGTCKHSLWDGSNLVPTTQVADTYFEVSPPGASYAWVTSAIDGPELVSGNYYWLGTIESGSATKWSYESGTASAQKFDYIAYADFNSGYGPYDNQAQSNQWVDHYIDYEEAGGASVTALYARLKIRSTKPPAIFKFSEIVKYARVRARAMKSVIVLKFQPVVKYARSKVRSFRPASSLEYSQRVKYLRVKTRSMKSTIVQKMTMLTKYVRVKTRSMKPPVVFRFITVAKYARVKVRGTISRSSLKLTQLVKNARTVIRTTIPDVTVTALAAIVLAVMYARLKVRGTISSSSMKFTQTVKNARVKVRNTVSMSSLYFIQAVKNARVKARSVISRSALNFTQTAKNVRVKVRGIIPKSSLYLMQIIKNARLKVRSAIPLSSMAGIILLAVKYVRIKTGTMASTIRFSFLTLVKKAGVKMRATVPGASLFEVTLLAIKNIRLRISVAIPTEFFKFSLALKTVRVKTASKISQSVRTVLASVVNIRVKLRALKTAPIMRLWLAVKAMSVKARALVPAMGFRFTIGTKIARLKVGVTKGTVSFGVQLWLGVAKFVTKALGYFFEAGNIATKIDAKKEDYYFVSKNS